MQFKLFDKQKMKDKTIFNILSVRIKNETKLEEMGGDLY